MSASAPLGRPSRNTGRVEADCTSATSTGEVVSVVISHAAATSFIHMQVLAATQVSHSMRNTGTDRGAKGEREASECTAPVEALCSRLCWAASSVPWARAARSAAVFTLASGAAALGGVAAGGTMLWGVSWWGWGGMWPHCAMSDLVPPAVQRATRFVSWALIRKRGSSALPSSASSYRNKSK